MPTCPRGEEKPSGALGKIGASARGATFWVGRETTSHFTRKKKGEEGQQQSKNTPRKKGHGSGVLRGEKVKLRRTSLGEAKKAFIAERQGKGERR